MSASGLFRLGAPPGESVLRPTMRADGAQFFPKVLLNRHFWNRGILFGAEPFGLTKLRWAVVDPRRHVMFAWQKACLSFVKAGTELDASAFTNGPFMDYPHGRLRKSLTALAGDAGKGMFTNRMLNRRESPPRQLSEVLSNAQVRHLQAKMPLGFVVGMREGIRELNVSRPKLLWFGRGCGLEFESYQIGRGDPTGMEEAIGGLFGGVRDYQPNTVDQFIRVGYWGLVPLTGDSLLERAGVHEAVEEYESQNSSATTAIGPCSGVVLLVAGWSSTQRLAELLSAIRVKDAVQFDGGDSLMFGAHGSLMIGSHMPPWKRVLQCWGLQFRPLDP